MIRYALLALAALLFALPVAAQNTGPGYDRDRWSPIHFKPAIDSATDEQCLACHREILADKPLAASRAGVPASQSKGWYQQLSVYQGEQDTFHRRHLVTPLARDLMKFRCNSCHQGNDPREEAVSPPMAGQSAHPLRKAVDVETTCLKCHGQMDWKLMGLPGPWRESGKMMGNNCLLCHAGIRTNRHQVDYLDAAAIERAGAANADVCYGCHGGRAWYRIAYPYARTPWPGMPEEIPDWAKARTRISGAAAQPPAGAAK